MPVLPSGKSIELAPQMRLINFIDAPPAPGLFWVDSPNDLQEFGNLPGNAGNSRSLKQVPLPESLDDFKNYISIVIVDEFGYPETTDYNLKNFPPEGYLNETDLQVWRDWINSEPVQLYLEMRMEECFDQVEYLNRLQLWVKENETGDSKPTELFKRYDLFLQKEPADEKKKRHDRTKQRAQKYIKRLQSMQIDNPIAQITWVDLLMEQFGLLKAWKEGELFFSKCFASNPEQVAYHIGYLKCVFEQKKYAEVEKNVWDAVAQYPQNIEYWQLLINVFFYQQQYDDALQIINSALSINPDNQDLLDFKYIIETAKSKSENL
ncbi:MAG TPA: hypothetical protein VF338_01280 [Leptolinea sp.]